jgi:hypothetical protein
MFLQNPNILATKFFNALTEIPFSLTSHGFDLKEIKYLPFTGIYIHVHLDLKIIFVS